MEITKPQFLFGDIVVVDTDQIGVILKTWEDTSSDPNPYIYDVYVRAYSTITRYEQHQIDRYRVRHKYLNDDEFEYQNS